MSRLGRRTAALVLAAALALAGCGVPRGADEPSDTPPPALAQRFADLQVAVRALTPEHTTWARGGLRIERDIAQDGGRVVCIRVLMSDSTGATTGRTCWYADGRPWVIQSRFTHRVPTLAEPWHELVGETFYTPAGRVEWAGLVRDGERIAVKRSRYAWLERNEWPWLERELADARALPGR